MYLRLNFTQNTAITNAMRLVDGIIKTSSVTNTYTLSTDLLPSFHTSVKGNLNVNNCIVVRTDSTSGVNSHFRFANNGSNLFFKWTLEFPVYDNPGEKFYYQVNMENNPKSQTGDVNGSINVGDSYSIVGGTWANSLPYGADSACTNLSALSAQITLGNQTPYNVNSLACSTTSKYGLYCYDFHCYVTNTALVWAVSGQASATGWSGTYLAANNFTGPFIMSQYTRYDSWNTANNGIIPVCYNTPYYGAGAAATLGKGISYDAWVNNENANALDTSYSLFRVLNSINANYTNAHSFPMIYHPGVEFTKAPNHWSNYNNPYSDYLPAVSAATGVTYRQHYSTTSGFRFPNITNTGVAAGLFPVKWRHSPYYNQGGNLTDKCKLYWYSGEYTPGDTFTFNNTIYTIWPNWSGPNYNFGIAVPRQ